MHNPTYDDLLAEDGLVMLVVEDNRLVGGAVLAPNKASRSASKTTRARQLALTAKQVHMRVQGWSVE